MASGRIDSATSPSGNPRCGSDSASVVEGHGAEGIVATRERAAHAVGVAHEARHEGIARRLVELARRALLRDRGAVHHDDAVRHGHRLGLVVRHVDDGQRRAAAAGRGSRRASARRRRASRFDSGSSNSSTEGSSTSARASATRCCWPPGELGGQARVVVAQADGRERLLRAIGCGGLRHARDVEPVAHVLEHGHVREQRVALEHHRHVALGRRRLRDVQAADADRARRRQLEPGDQPQRRRLAAPRRAEQRGERARGHGEREVAHGGDVAVALAHADELDGGRRVTRRCPEWADDLRRVPDATAEAALADQALDEPDHGEHEHDQHRAVGDRDAVVAVDDAVDDVRRRPLVLRGHEEDHRGHRGHRAHEAVHERGDDRGLEQRQQHAAQRREPARPERRGRLVEAAVDLRHRRHAGAHADRHVAEDVAGHEDRSRCR